MLALMATAVSASPSVFPASAFAQTLDDQVKAANQAIIARQINKAISPQTATLSSVNVQSVAASPTCRHTVAAMTM